MSLAIRVLLLLFLAAPLVPALPAHAQTTETAAVITELKPGRGRVEVKPAAGGDWKAARPLLALRVGDALRTSGNASAVVLLSGGRGTVRIEGASGTFTVPGAAAGGQGQKAKALVEASLRFLARATKEASHAGLGPPRAGRAPGLARARHRTLAAHGPRVSRR